MSTPQGLRPTLPRTGTLTIASSPLHRSKPSPPVPQPGDLPGVPVG